MNHCCSAQLTETCVTFLEAWVHQVQGSSRRSALSLCFPKAGVLYLCLLGTGNFLPQPSPKSPMSVDKFKLLSHASSSQQVLYIRGLYHRDLFVRTKLFGIPVRRSRHPDLTGYIREHLNSLRVSVASGEIHKLAVVFFDGCDTALERFVVEFGFAKEGEPQFSQADLDRSLKDCLLKLQFSDAGLRPLPNDCRFELVAYSSNPDAAAQHWVQGGSDVELSQPSIVPIKSVDLGGGGFRAQLHLEACLEYRS
mmetsp:Transcript_28559/g.68050  ORF Transcript_28559/g.68050 Transcript_28559/m.68050 type:complete len:252 (-) Transcript_28559:171-926(-)